VTALAFACLGNMTQKGFLLSHRSKYSYCHGHFRCKFRQCKLIFSEEHEKIHNIDTRSTSQTDRQFKTDLQDFFNTAKCTGFDDDILVSSDSEELKVLKANNQITIALLKTDFKKVKHETIF